MGLESRRFAQWVWACFLFLTGQLWRAERQLRKRGAVLVLTLHRVLEEGAATNSLPGMVVRRRPFKGLCRYLVKGYRLVRLDEAAPGTVSGRLQVACTFDDGWLDNFKIALPILQQGGIPCTLFICPGLMGAQDPFWPERVTQALRCSHPNISTAEIERQIEELKTQPARERCRMIEVLYAGGAGGASTAAWDRLVTWEQVAEMQRGGVSVGSHTTGHEILTTMPEDEIRRELTRSRIEIERRLGAPCTTLAYPNGSLSQDVRDLTAEAGYTLAFIAERGIWTTATDPLAIPRCNVSQAGLAGPLGNFSRAMFLYTTIWKAWRAPQHHQADAREQSAGFENAATTENAS
jgi:peptidoglycan/xylan/chitin deacetylase (PgdA/CDA1 family)